MIKATPMRIKNVIFAVLAAALLAAHPASASGPAITAKAALVMDADTGRIIISKDIHRKLPPASTTKLMAAVVALEDAKMDDVFKVSRRASQMCPTKVCLIEGDEITVEALLYSMLIKSANDAAAALAEGMAGSEANYAARMTTRAKDIGALDTNFKNASGLPAKGHYSTAYDLAVMLRYAMANERFVDISSTRYATLNMGGDELLIKNSNKLLWNYDGALCGKTGYTRSARDCYVGAARRDGKTLIVSILGSEHRWDDARALLDKGFELAGEGMSMTYEDSGKPVVRAAAETEDYEPAAGVEAGGSE